MAIGSHQRWRDSSQYQRVHACILRKRFEPDIGYMYYIHRKYTFVFSGKFVQFSRWGRFGEIWIRPRHLHRKLLDGKVVPRSLWLALLLFLIPRSNPSPRPTFLSPFESTQHHGLPIRSSSSGRASVCQTNVGPPLQHYCLLAVP